MSSAARTSTKAGQEAGPLGSLILGIILILIGLQIETERFRATAIVTGGLLTAYGLLQIISNLIETGDEESDLKKWLLFFSTVVISCIILIILNFNETLSGIAGLLLIGSVVIGLVMYKMYREAKLQQDIKERWGLD